DGTRALALAPKLPGFRSVDLDSGEITDVDLGGDPTDLELSPRGDLALVVLRDQKEVAFVRVPRDIADPAGIARASTGMWVAGQAAIGADGRRALLFSNA